MNILFGKKPSQCYYCPIHFTLAILNCKACLVFDGLSIDGPGMNQSTPQLQHGLSVNSPETYESELGIKGGGGGGYKAVPFASSGFRGMPESQPRDGEGVNPPVSHNLCNVNVTRGRCTFY